jgi:hypothetical protein
LARRAPASVDPFSSGARRAAATDSRGRLCVARKVLEVAGGRRRPHDPRRGRCRDAAGERAHRRTSKSSEGPM